MEQADRLQALNEEHHGASTPSNDAFVCIIFFDNFCSFLNEFCSQRDLLLDK